MIFRTHLRFYPYLCTRKSIKAFRCKKYKTNDQKNNEKKNFYTLMPPGACYDKHAGKRKDNRKKTAKAPRLFHRSLGAFLYLQSCYSRGTFQTRIFILSLPFFSMSILQTA